MYLKVIASCAANIIILATTFILTASIPVHAGPSEILAPVTPWNVNYGDKKCSAVRGFGTNKARVEILIDQFAPGDWFKLSIVGKRFKGWSEGNKNLQLRFGPDENWGEVNYLVGDFGKDMPAIFFGGSIQIAAPSPETLAEWRKGKAVEFAPISDAQRAKVRSLDLTFSRKQVQLNTGRLDRLFVALGKCTDNLVKSWGFDPALMSALKQRPAPRSSPQNWIKSDDYPAGSALVGERAMVSVRLNVDATGKVAACEIQQVTRDGDFGTIACKALTKRAQFDPAIDAAGKPIAAYWASSVMFMLPR